MGRRKSEPEIIYLEPSQEHIDRHLWRKDIWDHEDMVIRAERLARYAHGPQRDLAGHPYTFHLERVADRVAFCGDDIIAVAWLHDIVEDTDVPQDLIDRFFPETVARAVEALTHRKGEPLESYWTRVHNNREAFIVKLHGDMPDNNDPTRRTLDTARINKIGTKYATAIDFFWHLGQR